MFRQLSPFFGALVLILAFISDRQQAGDKILRAPNVQTIPVAFSRAALDDLVKSSPSPSNSFRVPNPTPVRVVQHGLGWAEVEILSGSPRRGWVFREWLQDK